jgi:hypothetical protein
MEYLLEAVFSVQSMPRLYNEDQLPLQESPEIAVKKYEFGVRWLPPCEDVSLGAEEHQPLENVSKQRSEHQN